jgi:hypothetical protein
MDSETEAEAFPMTIDEFCAGLSAKDRRVELIAAFHFDEKRAGNLKDTDANFRERFTAFANKPA